jgi:Domain of unknown function (DUF1996)
VKSFPAGLRMIAGDMHATSAESSKILEWTCGGGGPTTGNVPSCSDPKQPIHASLGFPSCWDGKHLDDHKSHMAYAASDRAYPRTHPVSLPKVSYELDYPGITGGPSYELASGGRYSNARRFLSAWDARVQNALVRECLNEARDCIDINRDGNILFKPRGDPDPIPPINLANFSARQTQVLEEPTSATPTPTATHKHATPAPSPSTSPAVAIKGAETNASPAMGWPAGWVARWLLHWLVISTTGIAPVARSGGHSSRLIRPVITSTLSIA